MGLRRMVLQDPNVRFHANWEGSLGKLHGTGETGDFGGHEGPLAKGCLVGRNWYETGALTTAFQAKPRSADSFSRLSSYMVIQVGRPFGVLVGFSCSFILYVRSLDFGEFEESTSGAME